ncbi:chaoptin [Toxorhynchites rutilus septentrionalis]|uniref:chaoptin n=1 Tax=Toxorhynchites rutilus septentrionalis TaxID=329112 RepID=UPI00247ACA7D|nr:chaoptin [Toxorhynchites rutilus septentrionalis]XP_055631987.1 chaoptin [Toxorhynchites rutilus septentrionalis]XP_055631994.1 chaoptin [Toxorhynchites rutilus septentrionalis]XP_055632001.1 chaoptin [Toxorhynchites rutilus septentrionalis]XP_055632009.1 chaoptin [Toxorhynchites rutilus septentrionalis]XP_055632020.1 chaoptin [Toxorhynchites rutilus septentrionalis]
MLAHWTLLFLATVAARTTYVSAWRPCPELDAAIKLPCRCNIEAVGNNSQYGFIAVDCERTALSGGFPSGLPIISFSHRNSGHHLIPDLSMLSASIRRLDFSNNGIRTIPEKSFSVIGEYVSELRLANNLLGDNLNPIFSTTELQALKNVKILDISFNQIMALDEGIFLGCRKLQEIQLDGNKLSTVPATSFKDLPSLRIISLRNNFIENISSDSFAFANKIDRIDLRYNRIHSLKPNAFSNLQTMKELLLAGNLINSVDERAFMGSDAIQKLDLSDNLIGEIPSAALSSIESLKVLNLSLNNIDKLESKHLQLLKNLQILDISRNIIASVLPGTFREQSLLKYLDLSLNSLRTIEDDAFEGLDNLQTLILRDNNILLIPGSALGRLPRLSNLYLDFNRVAALSSNILKSIQPENIRYLSLSRNVIREFPANSFTSFKKLIYLDISGNSLGVISEDTFAGLDSTLLEIKMSYNKISTFRKIDLPKLRRLDISSNSIDDLTVDAFHKLGNLLYLNMSGNEHITQITRTMIYPLNKLQVIDISNNGIKTIQADLFHNNTELRIILLNHNHLKMIEENTFMALNNLFNVDISHNEITTIKSRSFINTVNLRTLNLRGNKLIELRADIFNSETAMETLDLSDNEIGVFGPNTFKIHPRLRKIFLANNKLQRFSPELINSLDFLEVIDLSNNQLIAIDQLDYARFANLRELYFARNQIEIVSDMAFHNSTQLQIVDLSGNKLERLTERVFEGLIRIEKLDLSHNALQELPEGIFDKSRIQKVENLILTNNSFRSIPLGALKDQHDTIYKLDMSYNQLKDIPATNTHMVMTNIKNIDFSFNPMSEQATKILLEQPKTTRHLNLAHTGIERLPILETPYLQSLNLSMNNISSIGERVFEKTTLLQVLDVSFNKLENIDGMNQIWPKLSLLSYLDLSNNPIKTIVTHAFDSLEALRTLKIKDLSEITRLEKNAFKPLSSLSVLEAYNFAKLGYIDVQGILQELPSLASLDIEVKDTVLESDQLQVIEHPKLSNLGLYGNMLQSLSSGSFAGLRNKFLSVSLKNTSLTTLPTALLLPLPRSAHIDLDISGSKITTLTQPFLGSMDDRKNSLTIAGLNTNPIQCDCQARAFRRWIIAAKIMDVRCSSPENVQGRLLVEVGDNELVCDQKKQTTTTTTSRTSTITFTNYTSEYTQVITKVTPTTEQDIIWSVAPTTKVKAKTKMPPMKQMPITNDDTLIIGIVGGVIVFIFLLIIIICICRLKMNNDTYRGPPIGMSTMHPNGMQVNYKNGKGTPIYPIVAPYATLPYKQSSSPDNQPRPNYSTIGRIPYQYQNQHIMPPPSHHSAASLHSVHSAQNPYMAYQDDKAYR